MSKELKDTAHQSYADYLQWSDRQYELIDGVAYFMTPVPTLAHQEIVGDVFRQVANALLDKQYRVYMAPVDVRLVKHNATDESIDSVVQPDVFVVCDKAKLDRRGVQGAPHWILEVLSPVTAVHDMIKKRELYERYGVREYWLIHPIDRVLMIYQLQGNEFTKPEIVELSGETSIAVLDDVLIHWEYILARLPPLEDLY